MASITLQSKDHRELLDTIDKFRSQGVSRYVDLPEIIVCGDQSAGKSAVLEAISGLSFPSKDNLCTRFATELILRRNPSAGIKISITPDQERPSAEKEKLALFNRSLEVTDLDLSSIVEEAKEAMGLDTSGRVFSKDTLRVELSGPTQAHLTLVDLPGLFVAANREQSEKDAQFVKSMVLGYMRRHRSIILAVVSAQSQFALQSVTQHARHLDPRGERTLGLITKPDTLEEGSDAQRYYVELAQNIDVHFDLGWHVLKNRDFKMRSCSSAERDDSERQFFAKGVWATVDPTQLGIDNLKTRLSDVLKNQIILELPSVLENVEAGIEDCTRRLAVLGEARDTPSEKRQYLGRASQGFATVMRACVDGVYNDPFFTAQESSGEMYTRRLRAVIQGMLMDFSDRMRSEGHSKLIFEPRQEKQALPPRGILRPDYIADVKELMKKSRGRELPGTFNPMIIGELFQKQCKPWPKLANKLVEDALTAVHYTISQLVGHVAVEPTAGMIRQKIGNEKMIPIKDDLKKKVEELLKPHVGGHPITYNRYLTETVQKIQADRQKRELEMILKSAFGYTSTGSLPNETEYRHINPKAVLVQLLEKTQHDMESYSSSWATDYMEAYYRVCDCPEYSLRSVSNSTLSKRR